MYIYREGEKAAKVFQLCIVHSQMACQAEISFFMTTNKQRQSRKRWWWQWCVAQSHMKIALLLLPTLLLHHYCTSTHTYIYLYGEDFHIPPPQSRLIVDSVANSKSNRQWTIYTIHIYTDKSIFNLIYDSSTWCLYSSSSAQSARKTWFVFMKQTKANMTA